MRFDVSNKDEALSQNAPSPSSSQSRGRGDKRCHFVTDGFLLRQSLNPSVPFAKSMG